MTHRPLIDAQTVRKSRLADSGSMGLNPHWRWETDVAPAIHRAMAEPYRIHMISDSTGETISSALRATVEETRSHNGAELDVVRGLLLDSGKQAAFYPGALPEDPAHLLGPAREGAAKWLDEDYQIMSFAPAPLSLKPGDGPPHIRLDKAVEFLIGDRL